MKWIALVLTLLLISLQYRLWFGQGSVRELDRQQVEIAELKKKNAELRLRNQRILAEIRDLKQGTDSIEERARNRLGMIRDGEVFFRILKK